MQEVPVSASLDVFKTMSLTLFESALRPHLQPGLSLTTESGTFLLPDGVRVGLIVLVGDGGVIDRFFDKVADPETWPDAKPGSRFIRRDS